MIAFIQENRPVFLAEEIKVTGKFNLKEQWFKESWMDDKNKYNQY